ncbi:FAD-dependent oxidoreductase [Amycolatopsis sp. A133]|uniref:protoporphyrinogen/coproporphyrinogen oxidase n=1 Tax=Amycolatopsis sp. A133 TaxID=3064472 RepID=UPI0027FDE05A|nr:FAD-dependent oxidoreductase [Amycolatopsis sp. A133]MDQ7803458.1 FAD-dependent oxidoreductase [Amycolatopsis sp. A133]
MTRSSDPVVIVGAGPAGLSAAYHLPHDDYIVLEAGAEPGGLCRSHEFGGAVFDVGGHAFFTRHPEVRELIGRLCPVELFEQPRSAWVYSHGTYVRYPFQSHLHGLPTDVVRECLVGLLTVVRDKGLPPTSLADWIERTFGDGIRRHFLEPYNTKLWAHPLREITPAWTGQRIVTPDIDAIVAGALEPRHNDDYVNARVTYPADGGFSTLYQGFVKHVGERLRCGVHIDRIDLDTRTAHSSDGEDFPFSRLVSTMPLDLLVERVNGLPAGSADAARRLRHNSLHLVNLAVDAEGVTKRQRVYVADPEVPFHKLVLNSNSSPALRARPRFGIQAEVSFSPLKHVEIDGLAERVVAAVAGMGLVDPGAVRETEVCTVPYAYPVHTSDTTADREYLLGTLLEAGIVCAGRFGEWLYINSDDAVLRGKKAAEEVCA